MYVEFTCISITHINCESNIIYIRYINCGCTKMGIFVHPYKEPAHIYLYGSGILVLTMKAHISGESYVFSLT